jgi:type I restriction enzyme S subunit
MADDFRSKTIPLSKATKFIVDNRGRTAPTVEHGIPLIATNCISNDQLYPAYEKLRYVSKETYANWFRSHPLPGDIILTNKGSQNGAICLVPDPVDFVIAQDMVALRADEKIIDPLFLFAALRSANVQQDIKNLDVSGVIPHFKKSDFDKLNLPYPERDAQELIGRIYYDFCAKIELNRKTNETLEAMAKALFKSWFVDFDPVRAKVEGRPTGLPAEISDLFPDSFEDSELGEIPSGWEVKALDEIAHFLNGLALQKFPPEEGGATLPVIKIAQLKKGDSTGADRCSTSVPAEYVVRDGDVLFSWSGSLAVDIWSGGDGALNQHLFKVTSKTYGKWFFYQWVMFHLPVFQEIAQGKATTMGHIQRHHLSEAKALLPGPSLLAAMDSVFSPLLDRVFGLRRQSIKLSSIRDALLPKLISGELRIPDAEKLLEEAGI